ncbi:nuclear transport factor 2 family protein [Amycolatopsis thermoflava]|uniref:nuclear transport factor 2 family protein n=1 Tax=Amycolatopsis thermoflava TaxID=84480 RepID=UPI00365C769B
MPDRAAIEDLLNRYSLAYDLPDLERMESVFTKDAVFSMAIAGGDPVAFEGRDAIMSLMRDSLAKQTDQRRHINSNLIVHGTDDGVIRTTHYLTLVATENGAISLLSAGVYRNEIVERDGELKLQKLHLDLDKAY